MNRYFEVNVNFMLCPSEGMKGPFELLPPWLIWPSYRTVIVTSFFILSFPICYTYIGMSYLIMVVIEKVKYACCFREEHNYSQVEDPISSSKIDNRYSLNNEKQKCF